jgi:hypothetical protein
LGTVHAVLEKRLQPVFSSAARGHVSLFLKELARSIRALVESEPFSWMIHPL